MRVRQTDSGAPSYVYKIAWPVHTGDVKNVIFIFCPLKRLSSLSPILLSIIVRKAFP